ncbi:ethanolamine ammonia-lyase subunit EutC [Luteolibacter sp. AS25]|uniref:ethanolamine ammonia-lyase subunit EutC n=1 Tax=Luteolibacter sp. AS25 TaxID=3135776 RepID=UPI00398B92A7
MAESEIQKNSASLSEAPDSWADLRRFTSARIAIGRTGGSQRTSSLLDFRLSHARARDAVWADFDTAGLENTLKENGLESIHLTSNAEDRRDFLLRPDHGRKLSESSRDQLAQLARIPDLDLVPIVSDGLAANAAERHAAAVLVPLISALTAAGWRVGPVVIVPMARVKLQDEIGAAMGARFSLMLLGERPGLGAPDSLGAYFTSRPGPEKSDADRNCISNIRKEGLMPVLAAKKIEWLLRESRLTGLGGVALKDNAPGETDPRIV